jgi:DNA modification methylase
MRSAASPKRSLDVDRAPQTALNRICAYFTMFPLRFPYLILRRRARAGERVLDPFCGRGTTNYAARLCGLDNVGVDSSPVAAAIAGAKVISVTPSQIAQEFNALLEAVGRVDVPDGEFWRHAFAPRTLATICRLRSALLAGTSRHPHAAIALRALMLGALHGPVARKPSHLSNQAPRTFAPKPAYSVKFWKARGLEPAERDVAEILVERARRYFGNEQSGARGRILHSDSRKATLGPAEAFEWVITSPPYYGMRTYVPDQWIRNWFLGGPPETDYRSDMQLKHSSPEDFIADLATVWERAARVSRPGGHLVVRFGGINDRHAEPLDIIKSSLRTTKWRVTTIRPAGDAATGRRQALAFATEQAQPRSEYDVWAVRQ